MKFYGLWCRKKEDINKILESGQWINRLSNEASRKEQLNNIKIDSKVFLYQGIEDIKYKDTPFGEYVSSTTKEKSWFTYYRQDGIWTFDLKTKDKHQKIFYKKLHDIVFSDKEQDAKCWIDNGFMDSYLKEEDIIMSDSKNVLNQILYGPPGTGKTYNTINRALEIIDGEFPDDRSEAKSRFEELQKSGQIEFVTFHQSYGYEEFVEGIKAQSVNGEISYNVEDGVLKKLCEKAKQNNIFHIGLRINKYEIVGLSNELLKLKRQSGSIIPIPMYILNEILDLVEKKIISIEDINNKEAIDKMSISTEKFIVNGYPNVFRDLTQYYLDNKALVTNKRQNHIIIIDEINRGNISKIFGELITLIEPSKRIGAEEEIRVRLPYSNDEFGVPSNLFIIGTMNTADRSIALLDTALRRRFEFVEMMPNVGLLDFSVSGVYLLKLLQKINERVEYLYDREHTIGHAYFMELNASSSLDDLNSIMRNKIIPLLQEYFYDDWEKILLVLNDGFIEKKSQNFKAIFGKVDDEYEEEDKFLYSVKGEFSQKAYLKIYDKISKSEEE